MDVPFRGFRDAGCLIAIAGAWILLWVALVTAQRGWGPDLGAIKGLILGAIGVGLLALGAIVAGVSALLLARSGAGRSPSHPRAAVAATLAAVTLAMGGYVSAVWARKLVRERAEEIKRQEMAHLDQEDRNRRAAIWDANQARLREGLRHCLDVAGPPDGIGVPAVERKRLEAALHETLPGYRLVSEREIQCVRSLVFPDRLAPDGDGLTAAWAVTGRFEGDGAEQVVALATRTDALEGDPVLFRPGVPPLVERRDWPGRPVVLLGFVRGVPRTGKPWPPPEREYPGMVYDVIVSAVLERPLTGPVEPLVRLRWLRVTVTRGIDGKSYVHFTSEEPGRPARPAPAPR